MNNLVKIKRSKTHGQGVFAKQNIEVGQLIENCPLIIFPKKEAELLDKTVLKDYYFVLEGRPAIALGFGSVYNHSNSANVCVVYYRKKLMYTAVKRIKAGEELFINYCGAPNSKKKAFFEA